MTSAHAPLQQRFVLVDEVAASAQAVAAQALEGTEKTIYPSMNLSRVHLVQHANERVRMPLGVVMKARPLAGVEPIEQKDQRLGVSVNLVVDFGQRHVCDGAKEALAGQGRLW